MSYKKSNTVRTIREHAGSECAVFTHGRFRNFRVGAGSIVLTLLASSCTLERHEYSDDSGAPLSTASSEPASTASGIVASATVTATSKPKPTQDVDDDAGAPDATSAATSSPLPSASDDDDAGPSPSQDTDSGAPPAATSAAPGDSGGPPPSDDVHGKVIDFYGRALPDIDVRIGEATTTTDDDGEFTIPDVPETYTLDFRVNRNGVAGATYVWRYIGLTRRDPTLQSFQSSLPQRSMGMLLTSDLEDTSTDLISVAFGSNQGSQGRTFDHYGSDNYVDWAGPTSVAATGHGLVMHVDEDDFPTGYGTYKTKDISFSDGSDLDWELAVDGATDVAVANVSGTVSVANEEYRSNFAFLNFTSNAVLSLFETEPTGANFTYSVPSIPNASVLLVAENTGESDWSGAYAYRHGVAAGQSDVNLQIPAAPVPELPLPGDTVDEASEFSWDSDAAVTVVRIEEGGENALYRGIYIVTSQKSLTAAEAGFDTLRKGRDHFWELQTHGDCQSVDECAGADGALDPMYFFDNNEFGLVKRDGSAAYSSQFGFATAP